MRPLDAKKDVPRRPKRAAVGNNPVMLKTNSGLRAEIPYPHRRRNTASYLLGLKTTRRVIVKAPAAEDVPKGGLGKRILRRKTVVSDLFEIEWGTR
jgi:hypothetical protein